MSQPGSKGSRATLHFANCFVLGDLCKRGVRHGVTANFMTSLVEILDLLTGHPLPPGITSCFAEQERRAFHELETCLPAEIRKTGTHEEQSPKPVRLQQGRHEFIVVRASIIEC